VASDRELPADGKEAAPNADLETRLLTFAVRIIRLVNALPKGIVGRQVSSQMLRSGTSAGANYAEAQGAEPKADFTHKLGIVHKELKETRFWLRLIHAAQIVKPQRVEPLRDECEELCAITGQAVLTAKGRKTAET